MNQNKIHNYDEYQENNEYETELEYWEEQEKISQTDSECQFTMCFYCNKEIEVDYLLYHQCIEVPNIWQETNSSIDHENEEIVFTSSEEEDNGSIVDALDIREINNEFRNLEESYYKNLNNSNTNQEENNNSTNIDSDTINYNLIPINNYNNLDNLNRNNINYSIPIHEIPDILRERVGLPTNNFSRGLHSALDQDIIYVDNYQRWCNIIVLDMSEECNICLNKKNKFHQFKTCNHRICEECCFKWFEKNNTCPICRTNITKLPSVIPILTSGYRKICV